MKKMNLSELFIVAAAKHGGQASLAKRCGVSQSMISLYVCGRHQTIKAVNVPKIARCLGITPAQLLKACEVNDSAES